MRFENRFSAVLIITAGLIFAGLPVGVVSNACASAIAITQSDKPDAKVTIKDIKVQRQGNISLLIVTWDAPTFGGAAIQGFDIRADIKIIGGGLVAQNKTVGADFRKAAFEVGPSAAAKLGGGSGGKLAGNPQPAPKVETKPGKKTDNKINDKLLERESIKAKAKTSTRAASSPDDPTSGVIQPAPKPGGGGVAVTIESATVTVTGRFSGGQDAVDIVREFTPPATNPTGELRPRSGGGNADVQITKLIELAKSPRAAQCQNGKDCFELVTTARDFAGNGGKGFNVNLEVFYSDGSRKTVAGALTSPGRSLVLSVDRPAGATFNSVKVKVKGQDDGIFTRKDTRNELLSF